MKVAIIKYNAGNIRSVDYALKRLGVDAIITQNHEYIRTADKVIFPGVGEASTTMNYLKAHKLDRLIRDLKQPVLGICLGLQLMCRYSEENNTDCIGIFNETVLKFRFPEDKNGYKIPHMGWNAVENVKSPLLTADLEGQYMYFVHSYYAEIGVHTIAHCNYICKFSASLHRENFYATQFHPEKSGTAGAKVLENFIKL